MKKTLNNTTWKKMVFDICAMLKGRPKETQFIYDMVYTITGGICLGLCDLTITESQIRMSDTMLNNITDSELLQLRNICKAVRERSCH